jgi:chromate transporter
MSAANCLALFGHFFMLSFLAIGGALGTAPEMHRYLVESQGWLTHQQFIDSITLAQAAPGPNVLFVTLLGWQAAGGIGALATTVGIMLPSSLITFYANRWKTSRNDSRLVRSIRLGLSPLAIGLTASAGWVVAANNDVNWRLAAMTGLTVVIVLASKLNPLWLIAAGAVLGIAGVA